MWVVIVEGRRIDRLRDDNKWSRGARPAADASVSGRAAFVGSLALVLAIFVFDIASGRLTNLSGAVALAPFLAATLCSVRRTVVVTVVAVAAGATLLIVNQTPLEGTYGRVFALAFASVVAVPAAAARQRREQRLADVTRVAEVAQRALLTPAPPAVGPVRVAARYLSASSGALVGGDLYAVSETDRGCRLLLGDVRGKGLESVAQAALVLSAFRELAAQSDTLETLTHAIEERVRHHLAREDFVTAVLAEIDYNHTLRLVSCGHPPPALMRDRSYELIELNDYATPFGLAPQPIVQEVPLRGGDRLLFYTDGLIETRAESGGFITLDEILGECTAPDLDAALVGALERVNKLASDVRDDLALMLVEYQAD